MRITIDIGPTTAIANVPGQIAVPAETITPITTITPQPASAALSAGVSIVAGSGEGSSAFLPPSASAGITAGASAIAPPSHLDSFALASLGVAEGVLSAGSAKG